MTGVVTAISPRLEPKFAVELGALEDVQLLRRCADITELLGVVESGGADLAAISPDFPGMSGTVISELVMRGVQVLAVTSPTSTFDHRQCEAWGIAQIYVLGDGNLEEVFEGWHDAEISTDEPLQLPQESSVGQGEIICVWGPAGAPGRTTTALQIARQLGARENTLLIDADTLAPSVATLAGLVDDAPGILALARLVDAGALNPNQLRDVVDPIENHLDVVTGIGSASRWHELSAAAFSVILDVARQRYRWIVLDISAEFVADEALMFDTLTPSRNAVTATALAAAHYIVALAACDTVGLARFVSAWGDIREMGVPTSVLLNKARTASVGGEPGVIAAGALERFAGVSVDVIVPDATQELDEQALLGAFAKPLRSTAYTRALAQVCVSITGEEQQASSGKRRRWGRASRLGA